MLAFSHPILLWSFNHGFFMQNTIREEKIKTEIIDKFSTIITSDCLDLGIKLSMNHVVKLYNSIFNLRFVLQ